MNLKKSSSFFVSDSETGDELEQIIFSPHFADLHHSPDTIELLPNEEEGILSMETQSATFSPSLNDLTSYAYGKNRRSLRKRKAIQKLPYSLDRIRHKQLLQGYDITLFDSASEQIELPKRAATQDLEDRNFEQIMDDSSGWIGIDHSDTSQKSKHLSGISHGLDSTLVGYERTICNELYDSEIDRPKSINDPGSDVSEEIPSPTRENEIVFRGRLVNVKTGYRGILPRMAWEKSLAKSSNTPFRKKIAAPQNKKGIAKRKATGHNRANQDKFLLDDLIVPDDEIESQEEVPSQARQSTSPRPHLDASALELEEMNNYYQAKYHDGYSSEEFFDSESELRGENAPLLIELGEYEDGSKTIGFTSSFKNRSPAYETVDTENSDLEIYENLNENDSDSDSNVKDYDGGTINTMLSRHAKNSSRKAVRSKNSKKRVRNNKYTERDKRQSFSKGVFEKYERDSRSRNSRGNRKEPSSYSYRNHRIQAIGMKSPQNSIGDFFDDKSKKILARKKMKNSLSGLPPGEESELNRRVNTFNTTIEAPSHRYAFIKHNEQQLRSVEVADFGKNEIKKHESPPVSVMNYLLFGKKMDPPDIIKISLSDKQYILSKLGATDSLATMQKIFEHIINEGVTDMELADLSESLTAFLLHFKNPGVYDVVSEFHRKFRSKVSSLRDKAKPIHFYQIAICQLMFLEISKYANIENDLRTEIESKIVDNIISFFKLLAICYEAAFTSELDYLHRGYDILAMIIEILRGKEVLWQRLKCEEFPPQVALHLINVFPIGSRRWDILNLQEDYRSLIHTMKFVRYCVQRLNWEITADLILSLDRILKKKRFEDFVEEQAMSQKNHVMTSYDRNLSTGTILNSYLKILQSAVLSNPLVERIMPMGDISVNDSLSVLINRLNLLIVLGEQSDLNLEKRVEELIRPVVTNEYLSLQHEKSIKLICQSILNGIICLYEINCSKNLPFRAKSVVTTYKAMIYENKSLSHIWCVFLEQLTTVFETSSKSHSSVLKGLYPCFVLMAQKDGLSKEVLLLLRLYLKNLTHLGATWIQSHLFQSVKNFVQESNNWIDHYCSIGKFLVDKHVMSWWSFFIYNSVTGSVPVKLYFDYKIIQLCDPQSFNLLKKSLFSIATDLILDNETPLFRNFVAQLMNRECGMLPDRIQRSSNGMLHLLKKFVSILNNLSYVDLILKVVENIRTHYQDGRITKEFTLHLIEFLNYNFVDQIKGSHDFLLLKRELGVSDAETDKSSFRDVFKTRCDYISQSCYVESGLIHACSLGREIINYMEKLKSLFTFSVLPNPFQFFATLIEAHLVNVDKDTFRFKVKVATYYLKLINDILIARFQQLTAEEFLEQCKLYKVLCRGFCSLELRKLPEGTILFHESVRFQISILKIAHGFWEYDLLVNESQNFLAGTASKNDIMETSLSIRIDKIAKENLAVSLHTEDGPQESEQNLLLRKLHRILGSKGNDGY